MASDGTHRGQCQWDDEGQEKSRKEVCSRHDAIRNQWDAMECLCETRLDIEGGRTRDETKSCTWSGVHSVFCPKMHGLQANINGRRSYAISTYTTPYNNRYAQNAPNSHDIVMLDILRDLYESNELTRHLTGNNRGAVEDDVRLRRCSNAQIYIYITI